MKSPIVAPRKEAAIAQLVERFTRNEEVPSSSLGCGSKETERLQGIVLAAVLFSDDRSAFTTASVPGQR